MNSAPLPKSEYKYWAFISYSSKDRPFAKWLHGALENYRLPVQLIAHSNLLGETPPKYLRPLYWDRAEMAAHHDLGALIEESLRLSRFLIVVCSPNAARSPWVDREIQTFQRIHGPERILTVIIDGDPNPQLNNYCFPPSLTKGRSEPKAPDARKEGDGRTNAKLMLLAKMVNVSFDVLKRRDQERRMRVMAASLSAALFVMACMVWLAWLAYAGKLEADQQRLEANRERQQAQQSEKHARLSEDAAKKSEAKALQNEEKARASEAVAKASELAARESLYSSQFALAYSQFKTKDFSSSRHTLMQCEKGARNWEWRWLANQIDAGGSDHQTNLGQPILDVAIITRDFAFVVTPTRLVRINIQSLRVEKEWPLPEKSEHISLSAPYLMVQTESAVSIAHLAAPGEWKNLEFNGAGSCLSKPTTDGRVATLDAAESESAKGQSICRIWDVETGRMLSEKQLKFNDLRQTRIELSPDGRHLLAIPSRGGSGNYPGPACVFDLANGSEVSLENADYGAWAGETMSLSALGDSLTLHHLSSKSAERARSSPVSSFHARISLLKTSTDGHQILVSDGGAVEAWDINPPDEESAGSVGRFSLLGGSEDRITSLDSYFSLPFFTEGIQATILVGCESGVLQRIDAPNARLQNNATFPVPILTRYLPTLNKATSKVTLLDTSNHESDMLALDADSIWQLGRCVEDGLLEIAPMFPWLEPSDKMEALFSDQQISTWLPEKRLAVVRKSNLKKEKETKEPAPKPAEKTASEKPEWVPVDTATGAIMPWFAQLSSTGWSWGCVSAEGHLALLKNGRELICVEMESGKQRMKAVFKGETGIHPLACSHDGTLIVTAQDGGEEYVLWKLASEPQKIAGFSPAFNAFTFSPDGSRLFAAGRDLDLFETRTGMLVANLASFGRSGTEYHVEYDNVMAAPGGQYVLSTGTRYKPTEVFCAGPSVFDIPAARSLLQFGDGDERLSRAISKRRKVDAGLIEFGDDANESKYTFSKDEKGSLGAMFSDADVSPHEPVVLGIIPNSCADYVGLKSGDVILWADDFKASETKAVTAYIRSKQRGSVLRLRFRRGQQMFDKYVVLAGQGSPNPLGFLNAAQKVAQKALEAGSTAEGTGLLSTCKEVYEVLLKGLPSYQLWQNQIKAIESILQKAGQ